MTSRIVLALLITAALGLRALPAGDQDWREAAGPIQKAYPIREEKTERLLVGLSERCQRMLNAQRGVVVETRDLHQTIRKRANEKPRPVDLGKARQLSTRQNAIIGDATQAIAILRADGAAAAFPEVFEEVRADMKRVQARLETGDVGAATQAIENDILATLQEMVNALTTSR